ncbi:MAG: hypothetical protein R6X19_07515 [Kiritimatiellia bacterium]
MTHTKTLLTNDALADLEAGRPAPCLSLYQATHRRHPDNQQDPIRFRNQVKELERSLQHAYPTASIRSLLEPFESLGADDAFWNHSMEGLAVLGGRNLFRVFQLQRTVADLSIVADSFHTNPLRRFLQSTDRCQVLGLSFHKIQLFEGNRNVLDEIDPAPEVLQAIAGALGNALTEPHQSVASYGSAGGGETSFAPQPGRAEGCGGDRRGAVLSRHRPSGARTSFGQLATLLIEDGRQIPGRISAATGQVHLAELSDPEVDDVLDDLGQLVLSKGGQVALVPADQMPTDTGIAATRRF